MMQRTHFQVDPKLASLLGENYRSSEYALNELIDNAWDADATSVSIRLPNPLTSDPLIIQDNGTGMTERELTQEYLVIASSRFTRKGDRTPLKNRMVKGRKGIGKFAGLLAANVMEIETSARGKTTRLRIIKEDLLKSSDDLESIDIPYETELCPEEHHGTQIVLTDLNQSLAFPNPDLLKKILILEYGRQADFQIYVNNSCLDIDDIPGTTFTEEIKLPHCGDINLRFIVADGNKALKQSGIALRVNGKIVGIPKYFGLDEDDEIPSKLARRIYGEIEANGLEPDVTADWGAIIENSIAFQEIKEHVYPILRSSVESVYKQDVSLQKARLQKQINRELQRLPEYKRNFAEKALEKVLLKFYGENESKISAIISVILEAFEKDEYWIVLKAIDDSRRSDVETFAEALETFGLLDMALIATQAQRRMQFLDELDDLSHQNETLEKTMHKALETNLWVFGAKYSLISSDKTLARVISDYTSKKYSGPRGNKRPDLFLGTDIIQNKLLIEFKRPSHTLSRDDENQATKYRDDLTSDFGRIDIILLGGNVDPKINVQYIHEQTKLLSYSALISNARKELQWLLDRLTQN
jgi:hypothetical protein